MAATHGLASTYRDARYSCRCDDCCRANTERYRADRRSRIERLAADPTLATHGSQATYSNWGCRCRPCTDANSAMCAAYKARRKARQPITEEETADG